MTHDPLVPDDSKLYRLGPLNMHQVGMLETLLIEGALEVAPETTLEETTLEEAIISGTVFDGVADDDLFEAYEAVKARIRAMRSGDPTDS